MNYSETLEKRNELIEQADELMNIYTKIADDLFNKETGKYAMMIHSTIDECGIKYEYYIDSCDYTAGRDQFFVSAKRLESLVTKYTRKEKLKKIKIS